MARNTAGFDQVWPNSGIWGASFRVMFALAALWSAVCVALWRWGVVVWPNLDLSLQWHIHEMTFGFGGAAVAGYLLTACSSWTGRAPVSGWPLWGLVALWLATRLGLVIPQVPPWLAPMTSLGYFWWMAALLCVEAHRGGKSWRPVFIVFCLIAGVGSAVWILRVTSNVGVPSMAPILMFALLASVVGLRMVPAFLQQAAVRMGHRVRAQSRSEYLFVILLIVISGGLQVFGLTTVAGVLYFAAGIGILRQLGFWSLRPSLSDSLLFMLVLGVLWLATGALMLGGFLMVGRFSGSVVAHALMMGAMGGLIMGVSARAFARRTDQGLKARYGTLIAFSLVTAATVARLAQALDLAAGLWCAGWGLYLIVILPHLFGPVPRPVFSGARET